MDWNWQNFSSQWINSKSNSSNLVKELGMVTLKTFKNSSGAILWAVWCLHFLGLLYDPMVWFILHMRLEVYLFKWWREYLGLDNLTSLRMEASHWKQQFKSCIHNECAGFHFTSLLGSCRLSLEGDGGIFSMKPHQSKEENVYTHWCWWSQVTPPSRL